MKLNYPVEIYKIPEEEGGGCSAYIPTLGRFTFVADGDTLDEAVKKVLKLKDYYIKELHKKGIPIPEPETTTEFDEVSGKFVVRITKKLHKLLIQRSKKNGTSLNQYVLFLLTKAFKQDKIENEMKNFIRRHKNLFYDKIETDYNFNLITDDIKKLSANIQSEEAAKLNYSKAG